MLLGRRREMETLERSLSDAAAGRGRLCVLYGEPGIGKTRLAAEAAETAAARGFAVAWGRAAETGGAPPYSPWTELLAALGGAGSSVMAVPERAALYEGVLSFLRERAAAAPTLIVLDDLHIADASSLELLAFLAPRLAGGRLAVLATVRDAEARAPGVAEVRARGRGGALAYPARR
jgi:ATP/maltotriose-dependent transcriptional regulator MalT